jgi:hypothetical protein
MQTINIFPKNETAQVCFMFSKSKIVVYLMSLCVNWAFFLTSGSFINASGTSVLKAHECQKRPNLHTNELNTTFFCSNEPLKDSKSLKIFKISLTFRLDKL